MKEHINGVLSVLHSYFLGVVLSWAAYPALILLTFLVSLKLSLSVYTAFSTLVLTSLLYVTMHTRAEKDKKALGEETRWYQGFIYGAIAFLAIYLLEVIIIAIANKHLIVKHPYLAISNLNAYLRLMIYMPYYWLYRILDPLADLVPKVTYLSALIPGLITILAPGFGYLMGINSRTIIKFDFETFKKKLLFRGEEKDD